MIESHASGPTDGVKRRVMLIDDDEDIRTVLSEALRRCRLRHRCCAAASGREALVTLLRGGARPGADPARSDDAGDGRLAVPGGAAQGPGPRRHPGGGDLRREPRQGLAARHRSPAQAVRSRRDVCRGRAGHGRRRGSLPPAHRNAGQPGATFSVPACRCQPCLDGPSKLRVATCARKERRHDGSESFAAVDCPDRPLPR